MTKFALLVTSALLSISTIAQADLSYIQKSTFNKLLPSFSNGVSQILVKGDFTRVQLDFYGRPLVMITGPDGTLTQIDSQTKMVTMNPLKNGKVPLVKVVAKVKKVGQEKLGRALTTHWHVDLTFPLALVSPPQIVHLSTEVWSGSTPNPLSPTVQNLALNDIPVNIRAMMEGEIRVSGDVAGMRAAFANVPLRLKTTINGIPIAVTETSSISHQNLSSALFKTPAGYRKVSFAQWTKVMNDAIAKNTGTRPLTIKP